MREAKNIILIGASSGIGRELARLYGRDPEVRLGFAARRVDELEALARELAAQCEIQRLDLAGPGRNCDFERLLGRFDRVDLVIYCAGFGESNPGLAWPRCRETLEVNVSGFTEIINTAYRHLERQKSGQLAAIASIGGLRGFEDDSGYSASKSYMIRYCEGLARKSRKTGFRVRIATILPGYVDTAMAKSDRRFWMCPAATAARLIAAGLRKNRRYIYVTRRWRLVAWLLQLLPWPIFERL